MPSPTAQDDWLAAFRSAVQQLRPEIGQGRYLNIIALRAWQAKRGEDDPREAAQSWVDGQKRP